MCALSDARDHANPNEATCAAAIRHMEGTHHVAIPARANRSPLKSLLEGVTALVRAASAYRLEPGQSLVTSITDQACSLFDLPMRFRTFFGDSGCLARKQIATECSQIIGRYLRQRSTLWRICHRWLTGLPLARGLVLELS